MGTRTFVTPLNRNSTRPKADGQVDLPLVLTLIALCGFGLIMVYSASWDFSKLYYESSSYIFIKQVVWLALGVSLAYGLSRLDYHIYRTIAVPIILFTIGLLIVVLFVKEVRLGAVRALFEGSVQPSELAKLVTVIYLSVWLFAKRDSLHDINFGLFPLAVILGIIGGLIAAQPDISAAGTVLILGGLLFFFAGSDLRQMVVLLVIAIVVGFIAAKISTTVQERIGKYVTGLEDPMQSSYHVRRSLEAIVKGGFFGVGLGRASTKLTGLPVPPTDSIFAVVTEELGVLGAMGLITLFGVLIWRGLRIADKAPDMLGKLLAAGLTAWIGIEAIINMMVIVGLFPFAGNALPFISAGGSSLLSTMAAIGIIMNVARQGNTKPQPSMTMVDGERREYSATLDLRGRNGRRSVSRPRRS